MYIPRLLTVRLVALAKTFPVVVVTGARQVGKSTLIRKIFGKTADCVVFDPVIDVENARKDPDLFLDNHRTPIILGEIQFAPEVVGAVKRRVDRDRAPGRYIITGSQQWEVMKSLSESLAGRVVLLDLDGFCLSENAAGAGQRPWLSEWLDDPAAFLRRRPRRLKPRFTLYEQIWRGWLPEAQFVPSDVVPDFQTSYIRTYIERDARYMTEIADLQLFDRFFRLACALTGREINFSEIGRELGLSPKTSQRWLSILRATYQWYEIPPFSRNAIKRVSERPKGFIADTGIACAAQAVSTPHAVGGHPLWGNLFETAVAGELRKQCALLSPRPNVYHWRTHAGAEVDFLLERDGVFYPLEVKATSRPTRHDASGVRAFRETYPRLNIATGVVLAPVESVIRLSDRDFAVPWDIAGRSSRGNS